MVSMTVKRMQINGLSDYNDDDNNFSDKKEKSRSQYKKNHSNGKVKYTTVNYSTGHDDIKGDLLANAQKFIDFDDCQILSDNT